MKDDETSSESLNSTKLLEIIAQGENNQLEFKDSRILKDPFKLAKSMAAMANSRGGMILVGVKDGGSIEGLRFQKEHEEYIMNVASNNSSPPIRPDFIKISVPQGDVYVIKITKKVDEAYRGVKTPDGLVYFVRVGSTNREMQPQELSAGKDRGVKVKPYSPSEKGFLLITDRLVTSVSTKIRWTMDKTIHILTIIGALLCAGFVLFFVALSYDWLGITWAKISLWIDLIFAIGLFIGCYLIMVPKIAQETKCPVCKTYFKYNKVECEVLSKRNVDSNTEEWTVLNTYRCGNCGHEEKKKEYEKYDKD